MDGVGRGIEFLPGHAPDVKPRVITKFEPWMALSFSEGSIGGDIERVNLRELEAFYGDKKPVTTTAQVVAVPLDDRASAEPTSSPADPTASPSPA